MKECKIVIHSINDINSFVNMVDRIEGEVTLSEDGCEVDAKDILGVVNLDLSKCLRMIVKNWKDEYRPLLDRFAA